MRLIKLHAPPELAENIKKTAFRVGINDVTVQSATMQRSGGDVEEIRVVNVETSTPAAKRFVDELLNESYFDKEKISFNIRQPRTLISREPTDKITVPLVEPATDLYQELWQFTHVSYGLVGRVLVAACLLAHGVIEGRLFIIVGGLLFMPILPMVMAISYGVVGRRWRLAWQGAACFLTTVLVLFAGGAIVALASRPPIRFEEHASLVVNLVLSAAVGVAATLASTDDAGRRELIGLAAASQIAVIPVWFGIVAVFGTTHADDLSEIGSRAVSFAANTIALVLSIMIMQALIGAAGALRRVPAI